MLGPVGGGSKKQPTFVFDDTQDVMVEMITRDRNHASVLMWSLANEPDSRSTVSRDYFSQLVAFVRPLEKISPRPLTFASMEDYNNDLWSQYIDVILINRYYGWYSDSGALPVITQQMSLNLNRWHATWPNKPILVSEFGADTVPGISFTP
jgi:beta-glucuronidase